MNKPEIKTMIRESNGATLEAQMFEDTDIDGYSVTYKIDGSTSKVEQYPNTAKYVVEGVIETWFNGVQSLNG